MARLRNYGGERDSATDGVEAIISVGASIVTTPVKGSRRAWKIASVGGGSPVSAYARFRLAATPNTNAHYGLVHFQADVSNSTDNIVQFASGTSKRGSIRMGVNGGITLYTDGNSQIGAESGTLTLNQYYQLEWYYEPSTGSCTVRLDGTDIDTQVLNAGGLSIDNIYLGPFVGRTVTHHYDNLIINDTTGSVENSWVGDQRLLNGLVVDMGDAVTDTDASPYLWQTSGGAVASGDLNNWNRVDEMPWDDGTTWSRANVAQHFFDIYALETRSTIGHVGVNDLITFVNVNGRMGGTGTTSRPFRYFFQYDSTGTGATYSGDLEANANAWFTGDVNDTLGALLHPIYPEKFGSALDSMEIGVYKNDGTSRTVNLSALWLEFTYRPAPRLLAATGAGT
jgi:hypothetical protein